MGKARKTRRLGAGCSLVGLLPVVGIAAALLAAPAWVVDRIAALHPGCVYRTATAEPLVALTIDDGPTSRATALILFELRRAKARATFFLLAGQVRGREHLVRRLVAEGHEIGNHFTRDRAGIGLSRAEFESDLLQADQVLRRFAPVRWARPGSGWYSGGMVETMRRHGYRCALGSVYPFDPLVPSAGFAARYILRHARPGAIVVLHDGENRGLRTATVLRKVLPELRRRGYRVVTVDELARRSRAWQSR